MLVKENVKMPQIILTPKEIFRNMIMERYGGIIELPAFVI